MKFPVFLAVVLLSSAAYAECPKGCSEFRENLCACEGKMADPPTPADYSKWVSDEKPRQNQTPLWATGDVKVNAAKKINSEPATRWDAVSPPRTEAQEDENAAAEINGKQP